MWTPRATETSQRQQPRFIKDLKGRQATVKIEKRYICFNPGDHQRAVWGGAECLLDERQLKGLGGQKAGHQGSSSYPKEFQLHPKGQQKICSCFNLENDRGAVGGKRRGCWITSGRETSHPPAEAAPQEPRGTLAPTFTPLLPHCTEHPAPFNQPRVQHAQERLLFFSLYPFVCLGKESIIWLYSLPPLKHPVWFLSNVSTSPPAVQNHPSSYLHSVRCCVLSWMLKFEFSSWA